MGQELSEISARRRIFYSFGLSVGNYAERGKTPLFAQLFAKYGARFYFAASNKEGKYARFKRVHEALASWASGTSSFRTRR